MNLDNRPKIGLALGGGSARGFAHLGVLKALEEKQIPIDYIAGCSMGAIIGSIYCAGTDLDRLTALLAALNTKDLIDLVVPRKGLIRGNKFESALQLLSLIHIFCCWLCWCAVHWCMWKECLRILPRQIVQMIHLCTSRWNVLNLQNRRCVPLAIAR